MIQRHRSGCTDFNTRVIHVVTSGHNHFHCHNIHCHYHLSIHQMLHEYRQKYVIISLFFLVESTVVVNDGGMGWVGQREAQGGCWLAGVLCHSLATRDGARISLSAIGMSILHHGREATEALTA